HIDKNHVEIEFCPGCLRGNKSKVERLVEELRVEEYNKKFKDYEKSFESYLKNLFNYGLFKPDLNQIVLKLYGIT
ncbi:MAG: hypothetical protein NZ942_01450, partial [Candidatus Aenigmarchaeota archaeon]|nr:hypothetical protein [Candidatus Aenigmarchaeota archaeon]